MKTELKLDTTMNSSNIHAVTGAFGYSGKYITELLLKKGLTVRTLTNSLNRPNPFGGNIEAVPFNFDNHSALVKSLQGVEVLYNTYWVRFNHKTFQHSIAVDNTLKLFEAAKAAGVKRIVHTSITNPNKNSHLEYFSGKAILEDALIKSGISYAILRPAVIFGREDILINNMAWMLRHLPIVGIFGDGEYKLQPIYVEDFALLHVQQGEKTENVIIDAIGSETFTYKELMNTIGNIIGKKRKLINVSDAFGYFAARLIGLFVADVVLTREEIDGLKSNLLVTNSKPTGKTRLTDWLKVNKNIVGKKYASELARRKNRKVPYFK